MIIVKIVTEETANKILESFSPPSKDFLICQSIDKLPDYLLKLLTKKFFIINSQECLYNPDFLVIPESIENLDNLEVDLKQVDLVITNINQEFEGISEKEEFESNSEYLARLDEFRFKLKLKIILENVKIVNITNEIQFIQITNQHEESNLFK